ncbi:hypothetical protein HYC85_008431 [Camellia sinensis]|uniref:Inhibitor I9 domain-containing protein n=1 Tax=Camellia sinensis TaxID=4442 RepID=A0A7J7HSS8_CAMSI|nr:hypothetical protein HYC85_008431 [Camellia sinensis]
MTNSSHILVLNLALPWLIMLLLLGVVSNASSEPKQYQTYIIHMDHSQKHTSFSTHDSWHQSTLNSLSSSPLDGEEKLLYTYNHVMHGFSARLTPSQLFELEKSPAHRATYQESFGKLLTTHNPKFLGLKHKTGVWPASSYGKNVIIGISTLEFGQRARVLLTRGYHRCQRDGRASVKMAQLLALLTATESSLELDLLAEDSSRLEDDFESARDYHSHGTHMTSTVAGSYVLGASHFGYARGTAKKVAPSAHVAMYKVPWSTSTVEIATSDMLASMDQAIADGVCQLVSTKLILHTRQKEKLQEAAVDRPSKLPTGHQLSMGMHVSVCKSGYQACGHQYLGESVLPEGSIVQLLPKRQIPPEHSGPEVEGFIDLRI